MSEKKRRKNLVYRLLSLICIAVFLFSLVKLVKIWMEYREAENFYDSAASEYTSQNEWKKLNGDEVEEGPPLSVLFPNPDAESRIHKGCSAPEPYGAP